MQHLASAIKNNTKALSKVMIINHFSSDVISRFDIEKKEDLEKVRTLFFVPLLDLLADYFKTGKEELLQIYLDERKRYSPHLADKEKQIAYHNYMINQDYQNFKAVLGEVINYEFWLQIHQVLLANDSNIVSVVAIGDCLMNEVRVFANSSAGESDVKIDFRCLYFRAKSTGGLNVEKVIDYIKSNNIDVASFSFFSFEVLPEFCRMMQHAEKMSSAEIESFCNGLMGQVTEFLVEARRHTNIPFVIHNVSGLPLGRWRKHIPFLSPFGAHKRKAIDLLNAGVNEIFGNIENCILMDEVGVVKRKGIRHCAQEIAPKRIYKGMFHTSYFGKYLAENYILEVKRYQQLRKCKALLIDFDNTLWAGVMAEGEVRHYVERQQLLKELKDVGILLIAVSKNSEENIRWGEMVLQKEDFAFLQIHWNPKSESIDAIVQSLNIGKDSFVLVDDNRHERSLVSNAHPEVVVLDAEVEETWAALARLKLYPNTQATEEAKKRTLMYQEHASRQQLIGGAKNSLENLKSLELWYSATKSNTKDVDRLVELINRTNQFNLTTKRYSKADVNKFLNDDSYLVIAVTFGDKFGSLGLVAAVIIDLKNSPEAHVDTFVMSCRAMGFSLEKAVMYDVLHILQKLGISSIVGHYIKTDRNTPAQSFYQDINFLSTDKEGVYRATIDADQFEHISWLRPKHKEYDVTQMA